MTGGSTISRWAFEDPSDNLHSAKLQITYREPDLRSQRRVRSRRSDVGAADSDHLHGQQPGQSRYARDRLVGPDIHFQ